MLRILLHVSVARASSTEEQTGLARGAARWALGSLGHGYDALVGVTVRVSDSP